jgi:carboxylesterase type B
MNAIKWTSQFIQQFGGDLEKIMLAGESAGATSVNIHMANNETNQLFDKAILESNPAGINLKPASDQRKLFRQFAKKVGCNSLNDNFTDCFVQLYCYKPEGMARLSPTPILSCTLMYGG